VVPPIDSTDIPLRILDKLMLGKQDAFSANATLFLEKLLHLELSTLKNNKT
jgi:hypothetical protein